MSMSDVYNAPLTTGGAHTPDIRDNLSNFTPTRYMPYLTLLTTKESIWCDHFFTMYEKGVTNSPKNMEAQPKNR